MGAPPPAAAPGAPPTAIRASEPLPFVFPTDPGLASAGALLIAVATRRIETAAAGTARPAPMREISDGRPSRAGAAAVEAAAGADRGARARPMGRRSVAVTGTGWAIV